MKFKATVYVRLRVQVDDSPGNAVRAASGRLSKLDIKKLRLGKVIDLYFEAPDREYAMEQVELLSDRLYANTVIEDWSFDLEEINSFPSRM